MKKGQRTKVKCRTNDKYWEGCLGIKDIETEKGVKGGLDDWMTQTYRTINVKGVFSVIGFLQSSSQSVNERDNVARSRLTGGLRGKSEASRVARI